MQYDKVLALLKGRLARFSASTTVEGYINNELEAAMEELEEEGFLPWFLYKTFTDTLAADSYTVTGPSDYLRQQLTDSEDPQDGRVSIYASGDTTRTPLELMDGDPVQSGLITITASGQTKPEKYYYDEINQQLLFDAWADKEYTVVFDYVAKGDRYTASPAASEEPLWAKHAPLYLIAVAGLRVATQYIKNMEAAQMFMADVQRERTKLIHRHTTIIEGSVNPNAEN